MPEVFVGVGSNVDRERRVRQGLGFLRGRFGALRVSPLYETAAVGFDGSPFFNFVVAFPTELSPRGLNAELHAIEALCGRDRAARKFAPRPLDLDLLLYGEQLIEEDGLHIPREDILIYGFVLKPLGDLAGGQRHPVNGRTFGELWKVFAGQGRDLQVREGVLD